MTPTWERAPGPPPFDGEAYMDATLRPYRSLSLQAFRWLLIASIVMNLAVAIFFLVQGAFPVVGFLGLDVLALFLAFRFNYRAARREERVVIGKHKVYVASSDPDGRTLHWLLNPVWARVFREGNGVLIRAGERQMRIGAFLSPKECETLAAALDAAVWRAKRGF